MGLTTSSERRSAADMTPDTGKQRRIIAFCVACWWPRFWVQLTKDEARQGFVHETCVASSEFIGPEPGGNRSINEDLDVDGQDAQATTTDRDSQTHTVGTRVEKYDFACGDRCVTYVDAYTQTYLDTVEVVSDDRTVCSGLTNVVEVFEETISAPGVHANDVAVDGGPSVTETVCAADTCSVTTSVSVAPRPNVDERHDGDDSEEEIVPYVLPVMEENRAKELNPTFKLWENRFGQYSKFDEGIMADRDSLYSGPPEVLAKLIASRCKSMGTVLDPFCGSGAIAIQLAKFCRKVIVMDKDQDKIAFARNNARVYGVEDRILFLVGDFFDLAQSLKNVDGIITSPPANIGIDNLDKFIEISHKVATKVLIELPKKQEKSDLYRLGCKWFNYINFEDISIDRVPRSTLMFLGPATNKINHPSRCNRYVVGENHKEVLLFSDGVSVNRRVHWIRGNNLFAYDDYLNRVDEFLNKKNTRTNE